MAKKQKNTILVQAPAFEVKVYIRRQKKKFFVKTIGYQSNKKTIY